MDTYRTYLLRLPSGGTVEVCKPHPVLSLGQGHILSPLLSAAARLTDEDTPHQASLRPVYRTVQNALADPDIRAEDLPFADLLAVYAWTTSSATGPVCQERPYQATDLLPLVTGAGAILIDAICSRYSVRPSILLGMEGTDFAVDLDIAVGYRGLSRTQKSDEVEAEDVWGNVHRIPAAWQQTEPGRVISADAIAADMARRGIKEMAFSTGGAIGCAPGEEFGAFNRFRH